MSLPKGRLVEKYEQNVRVLESRLRNFAYARERLLAMKDDPQAAGNFSLETALARNHEALETLRRQLAVAQMQLARARGGRPPSPGQPSAASDSPGRAA